MVVGFDGRRKAPVIIQGFSSRNQLLTTLEPWHGDV
jgi:hypothetical protein